ncbi:MAG: helix-turn-helix domain-containing protein [Clostridia bacterium]|nr:helix-turn-helix domain-containing protein [Clostridia bacterium]
MEKKTMGSFMAALRKANGLTQQQVADKLNVSNKTVSKWECDEGYPEITMLPAIAEIYSVTVDELLKGEKHNTDKEESSDNKKSEKQALYLFKTSSDKYYTLSSVSLVICACGLLISLFLSHMAIGIIFSLILFGASAILEIVAFMNYKNVLFDYDTPVSDDIKQKSLKKTTIFLISTFAFNLFSLLTIIVNLICGLFLPWILSVAFVIFIVSLFVYKAIAKKFCFDATLRKEYISYRQKVVKTVSIITAVVYVSCFIFPFFSVYVETFTTSSAYDFKLANYNYYTDNNAQTNYNKLKNHILNGNEIYYLNYAEENAIDIQGFEIAISEENGELIMTDFYEFDWEYKEFDTDEEMKAFIEQNVITAENIYEYLSNEVTNKPKISFEDKELSIRFHPTQVKWYLAEDILPATILVAVIVSSLTIITGYILCSRKKHNLK